MSLLVDRRAPAMPDYSLRNRDPPQTKTSYNLRPLPRSLPSSATLVNRVSLATVVNRVSLATGTTVSTFDHVTRHLPNKELVLEQASQRGAQIKVLKTLLNQGDWPGIIQRYESSWDCLPVDALGSFHDQHISMQQFCTLIFRWSLAKDFPGKNIRIMYLFDKDGEINTRAKEHIAQTFKGSGASEGFYTFLDEERTTQFFDKMRSLPPSERVFFYLDTPPIPPFNAKETLGQRKENTRTIDQEVRDFVGVNVFDIFTSRKHSYRMSPSFTMMQAFLDTYSGANAVKITPVIGLSTLEEIESNGENGTRDMALPFPGILLPKEADLMAAPYDLSFWKHDFYHALVANSVPHVVRQAFIQLAQAIQRVNSKEKNAHVKAFLAEFRERITDMELSLYRKETRSVSPFSADNTLGLTFLLSVSQQVHHVFERILLRSNRREHDTMLERTQIEYIPPIKAARVMRKIVAELPRDFCSKAKITMKDLKRYHVFVENELSSRRESLRILDLSPSFAYLFTPPHLKEEMYFRGKKMTVLEAAILTRLDNPHEIEFASQLLERKRHLAAH